MMIPVDLWMSLEQYGEQKELPDKTGVYFVLDLSIQNVPTDILEKFRALDKEWFWQNKYHLIEIKQ